MLQVGRVAKSLQVLSDVLRRNDIQRYFSRAAMEKALDYQAQGRVSAVEISDDLTHVSSLVRGSQSSLYTVDIELKFAGDRLAAIDGDCSCPMAFNCKHVPAGT